MKGGKKKREKKMSINSIMFILEQGICKRKDTTTATKDCT